MRLEEKRIEMRERHVPQNSQPKNHCYYQQGRSHVHGWGATPPHKIWNFPIYIYLYIFGDEMYLTKFFVTKSPLFHRLWFGDEICFLVTKLVSSHIRVAKRSNSFFFLNTFGNETISSPNVFLANTSFNNEIEGFLGLGLILKLHWVFWIWVWSQN